MIRSWPAAVALCGLLALVDVGCPQAVPFVAPSAALAACVAADALKGDSVAQMATDCGSDALSVIMALLASEDAAVKTSPAYHEAEATRKAMKAAP